MTRIRGSNCHPAINCFVVGSYLKSKPPADGITARYKARLVAYGNRQEEGIDFEWDEICAPVVKYKTLRLTCALAAEFGFHMHK